MVAFLLLNNHRQVRGHFFNFSHFELLYFPVNAAVQYFCGHVTLLPVMFVTGAFA